MHYTYKTNGTCSSMIDFDIVDGKLHNITYTGSAHGVGSPDDGTEVAGILKCVECHEKTIAKLRGKAGIGSSNACGDALR